MQFPTGLTILAFWCLCWFAGPPSVGATPYASAVTNIGGTVSFILNESADDVSVVLNGVSTNSMGSLAAGLHAFNLGGAKSFEIVVTKVSTPGWLRGVTNQISADTNAMMQFVHQRGVALNRNADSPMFGRAYVSVSLPGMHASGRHMSEGIYTIDPSLLTNAIFQGTNGLTAGLIFNNPMNNGDSPFRLTVGEDDNLYICDFSLNTGSLYFCDPDVTRGANVFGLLVGGPFPVSTNRVRGSIAAAHVEGSTNTSDLTVWVIDEDLQSNRMSSSQTERNSVWHWNLGAGPFPVSNAPVRLPASPLINFAAQLSDLTRGPDGKFYVSQRRGISTGSPGARQPGVFVMAADGATNLWDSFQASTNFLHDVLAGDIFTETGAIDVSKDGKYLAVLRRDDSSIQVVPLTNGIPDLSKRIRLVTAPTNGPAEDIAFDAANNIFYVSSGQGYLRVLSPGGYSRALTRSAGGFELKMGEMVITSIQHLLGGLVRIDFVAAAGGNPTDFVLETASTAAPTAWIADPAATLSGSGTAFSARTAIVSNRLYRVRRGGN